MATIFETHTGRKLDAEAKDCLGRHPAVILLHDGALIGFCYSKPFAPDILQLANLFIVPSFRNKGYGKMMLQHLEPSVGKHNEAVILIDTLAYPTKEDKPLASSFYQSAGYRPIWRTQSTTMYGKRLPRRRS